MEPVEGETERQNIDTGFENGKVAITRKAVAPIMMIGRPEKDPKVIGAVKEKGLNPENANQKSPRRPPGWRKKEYRFKMKPSKLASGEKQDFLFATPTEAARTQTKINEDFKKINQKPMLEAVPSQRDQIFNGSKFNSVDGEVAETWLENMLHRVNDRVFLRSRTDDVKKSNKAPIELVGLDRSKLQLEGLSSDTINRIYRAIYVYSMGFHEFIRNITQHRSTSKETLQNIWKVYSHIIEECEEEQTQNAVTSLFEETRKKIKQVEHVYEVRIQAGLDENAIISKKLKESTQRYEDSLKVISEKESIIKQQSTSIKDKDETNESLNARIKCLQETLTVKKEEIETLRQKLRKDLESTAELQKIIITERNNSKKLREMNARSEKQFQETTRKLKQTEAKLEKNAIMLKKEQELHTKAAMVAREVRGRASAMKVQMEKLEKRLKEKQNELSASQQAVIEAKLKVNKLDRVVADKDRQINLYQAQHQEELETSKKLRQKLSEISSAFEKHLLDYEVLKQENKRLVDTTDDIKAERDYQLKLREEAKEEINRLDDIVKSLTGQLDTMFVNFDKEKKNRLTIEAQIQDYVNFQTTLEDQAKRLRNRLADKTKAMNDLKILLAQNEFELEEKRTAYQKLQKLSEDKIGELMLQLKEAQAAVQAGGRRSSMLATRASVAEEKTQLENGQVERLKEQMEQESLKHIELQQEYEKLQEELRETKVNHEKVDEICDQALNGITRMGVEVGKLQKKDSEKVNKVNKITRKRSSIGNKTRRRSSQRSRGDSLKTEAAETRILSLEIVESFVRDSMVTINNAKLECEQKDKEISKFKNRSDHLTEVIRKMKMNQARAEAEYATKLIEHDKRIVKLNLAVGEEKQKNIELVTENQEIFDKMQDCIIREEEREELSLEREDMCIADAESEKLRTAVLRQKLRESDSSIKKLYGDAKKAGAMYDELVLSLEGEISQTSEVAKACRELERQLNEEIRKNKDMVEAREKALRNRSDKTTQVSFDLAAAQSSPHGDIDISAASKRQSLLRDMDFVEKLNDIKNSEEKLIKHTLSTEEALDTISDAESHVTEESEVWEGGNDSSGD